MKLLKDMGSTHQVDFSFSQSNFTVHEFQSAFHVLRILSKGSRSGQTLNEEQIYSNLYLRHEKYLDKILIELEGLGWILKTEDELWALGIDLEQVTLWDLYQQLPYALPKSISEEPLSVLIGQSNEALSDVLDVPVKQVFLSYDEIKTKKT